MKIGSTIAQSLRSIFHNPVRSALTILGIVIGIAAVIAVVGLGKGLQQTVNASLSSLDANRITVSSTDPSAPVSQRQQGGLGPGGGGGFRSSDTTPTLTASDIAALAAVPGVKAVSAEASKQVDVSTSANATTANVYNVVGTSAQYPEIRHLSLAAGSWLTPAQVAAAAPDIVLGSESAAQIFGAESPLGRTIYLAGQPFTVIGVLAPVDTTNQGPGGGGNANRRLFTGYLAWANLTKTGAFSSVLVTAQSEDQVNSVSTSITTLLNSRHGIAAGANPDTSVTTAADVLKARSSITGSFTTALTGIAAVSLLVGGIGIMNIMLVTVTERTREIGLRRAVGAKGRNILGQFLTEAVILTLIGGVLGLLVGYLLGAGIGSVLVQIPGNRGGQAIQAVMDPSVAALAVIIAVIVGVVFGLFPAIRAARLDPAAALRYE